MSDRTVTIKPARIDLGDGDTLNLYRMNDELTVVRFHGNNPNTQLSSAGVPTVALRAALEQVAPAAPDTRADEDGLALLMVKQQRDQTTARAETEALVEEIIRWDDTVATDGPCDGTWDSLAKHLTAHGWTRHHLATQEPTEALVNEVALAMCRGDGAGTCFNYDDTVHGGCTDHTDDARAALSAARAAGRDAR